MGFTYLEHTADVMFSVHEKTLDDLFRTAALACFDVMADPSTVQDKVYRQVSVRGENVADLLFNFLQEIIYLKDADGLVFCSVDHLEVQQDNEHYGISCVVRGDVINAKKQTLRNDVKAVTLHQFVVEQRGNEWYAQVILDI